MSFWFALTMAAFTLLFGARKASATEPNRGIVVALGLESVLKLVALLAIGLYAALSVRQAGTPLLEKMAQLPPPAIMPDYLTMVALGAISAFTLPHQFHVGVVELRQTSDLRTARWMFPVYLLLIGLPSVPMALAGAAQLPASVSPDLYVLALPQAGGHHLLALLAYLGSLSAATGMMILSGLTLSIMLGNHGFGSRLLDGIAGGAAAADLRPRVLAFRRAGILAVFLMAWLYSRAMSDTEALSDFGLMSFTALSQLAPAVLLAVYRPRTPSPAIIAGIVLGSLAWLWLVLLPMVVPATPRPRAPMNCTGWPSFRCACSRGTSPSAWAQAWRSTCWRLSWYRGQCAHRSPGGATRWLQLRCAGPPDASSARACAPADGGARRTDAG
ncbi:hypothetical protein NMB32_17820 [Stenotrophomonas sp. CD2]|nr:hypothetical protein NMB32_17820 [Stenotrophomonas sp. CD2]